MKLQTLEDLFRLSGDTSPPHVTCPVKVIYLDSVVRTAQQARNPSQALTELAKFHRAAMQHGFRGRSFGGKNGVVEINDSDVALGRSYARLLGEKSEELERLGVNLCDAVPVKVVAHVENGNRLLGVLDKASQPYTVYLLGVSNYSGRVA